MGIAYHLVALLVATPGVPPHIWSSVALAWLRVRRFVEPFIPPPPPPMGTHPLPRWLLRLVPLFVAVLVLTHLSRAPRWPNFDARRAPLPCPILPCPFYAAAGCGDGTI